MSQRNRIVLPLVSKQKLQGKDLPNSLPASTMTKLRPPTRLWFLFLRRQHEKYGGDRTGLEPGTMDRQRGNASPFARADVKLGF